MKIEYPKWIYHKTLEAKIVQNKEEHDEAGPQWKESPAEFKALEEAEVDALLESIEEVPKKKKGAK